jgi:hypothetical protein
VSRSMYASELIDSNTLSSLIFVQTGAQTVCQHSAGVSRTHRHSGPSTRMDPLLINLLLSFTH